jgi:hypothetical protein
MKAATLSTAAVTHANAISFANVLATTNLITLNNTNTITGLETPGAVNNETANLVLGESQSNTPVEEQQQQAMAAAAAKLKPQSSASLGKGVVELSKYDSLRLAATKSPPNEKELLELFDENNSIDYKKITVPISLTLFVLSSYILIGGILFKTLEDWTVLEGVYFCFITLSTIGLGDYVPGNSINDSDTQAELKLVGCSLYLLMGLSLIAMCFNLMQEEVSAKFRRLAVRLGIIDDPNYW